MAELQIPSAPAGNAAAGLSTRIPSPRFIRFSSSPASSPASCRGKLVCSPRALLDSHNGVAVLPDRQQEDAMLGILYTERFTVRCYEVGTDRRASIQTIANLLQEVACNQVRTLGFSTDGFATTLTMRKLHVIWVTIRMHIEMDEYPLWGDTVELQTWFQENRHGTRRDWLIKNVKTGATLGRATSSWVMMKEDTRRFARVTDEIRAEFVRYGLHPPRFAFHVDHKTYTKQSLPRLEQPLHHVSSLKPRRVDLDMNQHVNNVAYIGWMLESLPASLEKSHELRSIILEFKHECKHHDSVESMARVMEQESAAAKGEQEFLHLLTLEGSDREINRGWTRWVQRKKDEELLNAD